VSCRIRQLYLLLAIAHAGVIFYLSSRPGIDIPPPFPHMDKCLHALVFGVLGFLVLGAMRPYKQGYHRHHLIMAIAITAGYGILDEIHQHYVPGRMPDGLDVVADLVGALIGIWLMHKITRRRMNSQGPI
jgi:VanZ family protein